MATMAEAGPGRRQDPGASSGSSLWLQEPKNLGNIPLLSQAHYYGVRLEEEQLGLEWAPKYGASNAGGSLTRYATNQPQELILISI